MNPMLIAGLAKAGGEIVGGIGDYFGNKEKIDAYRKAANLKMDAENKAYGIGKDYYNMLEREYSPEASTYMSDVNLWRQAMGQAPLQMGQFDESKYNVNAYLDPSMKYQQEQATKAVQQSAAARGGMFAGSGATAKALQDRATKLAQQDYGNAFERMQQDRGFGYGKFKDYFTAAKQAEEDRLSRLGDITKQSGAARQNLFESRGGLADLGMSKERSIADLMAGKETAKGDFYASNWGTLGNLGRSVGDTASQMFASQSGGIGGLSSKLGVDLKSLSQDQKMALLTQLLGSK